MDDFRHFYKWLLKCDNQFKKQYCEIALLIRLLHSTFTRLFFKMQIEHQSYFSSYRYNFQTSATRPSNNKKLVHYRKKILQTVILALQKRP